MYETILSGDLSGDDLGDLDDPNRAENSYHVITGSGTNATACLDGFTITGGNANGSFPDYHGGGMYNDEGNPVVSNCKFGGNSAERNGGGIYNTPYSDPIVTNCVFNTNSAGNAGGGMYTHAGKPVITNCEFNGNSAGVSGGAMSLSNNSPTITYCDFVDNSAHNGGGIYNSENSPKLANCTFIGNSAGNAGGGMYNDYYGGALVDNCTFIGNSGGDGGGGVYNRNNTVLKSCILWGNTSPGRAQILNSGGSTATISYSNIQGGYPGTGNIDADPLFIDLAGPDDILGTADDDLHLSWHSPCINAGNPSGDYTGQVDLDNQPRVTYGRVDMGTDEVFPIAGDFEPDEDVDFVDFAIFSRNWQAGIK